MGMLFSGSELIEIAIRIERNGISFYEALAQSAKDAAARAAYQYLADQEREHIKDFQNLSASVDKCQPREIYTGEYSLYLKALVDSQVFTDDQAVRQMAQRVTSDAEAIQLALGAEKDSILFYTEMRDLIRSSDRKVVDNIIEEERAHLRQLSDLKRKLAGG